MPPPRRLAASFRGSWVHSVVLVLVFFSLSLASPSAAGAQAGADIGTGSFFDNFWLRVGVGGAGTRFTCDLCEQGRDLGPSAEVSVGSYARPNLRVGVEAGAWTHDDNEVRESVYRLGVIALLRPRQDRGLYLLGGFGWSRWDAIDYSYDAPRLSLGAGWDHPLGRNMRVGNQITLDASSFGSLRNEGTTVERNVGLSLVRLSVHIDRL